VEERSRDRPALRLGLASDVDHSKAAGLVEVGELAHGRDLSREEYDRYKRMDREARIEENERLFREVNERVDRVQEGLGSGAEPEWICECGDETCFDKLRIGRDAYHEIRTHHDWFLIKPGHEKPDVERLVREGNGFVVVEKNGVQ
jgi:hypothetical protein